MNRSRLLLSSILLSVASLHTHTAVATTYHVDSQSGNDRNSGREAVTAWKSHTKVQETELRPGDIVMFKRGSQFSGPIHVTESGTPDKPIVLKAYGSADGGHLRSGLPRYYAVLFRQHPGTADW